jgi:acetyl-CoA carboxylase biotin carboxyl carrier protein
MNLKELKELIELVSEKGFAEFEIERQGFRLRISRFSHEPTAQVNHPAAAPVTPVIISSLPAPIEPHAIQQEPLASAAAAAGKQSAQSAPATESAAPEAQLHEITSPIVGTFYRAPSPNSEPFVKIGDQIEVGTVVCIIEAMKLMNEIESGVSGEVVKIYVENGQPVEYGQPLFGIKV